jgi:hypothetical protein
MNELNLNRHKLTWFSLIDLKERYSTYDFTATFDPLLLERKKFELVVIDICPFSFSSSVSLIMQIRLNISQNHSSSSYELKLSISTNIVTYNLMVTNWKKSLFI